MKRATYWKHLQKRSDRIDSREGQAGQAPKFLELRIIRSLRETFIVNENEVLIGLGASGVNL